MLRPSRCRILFFFQAEDGIRDTSVTGVQTCALPISADGTAALGNAAAGVIVNEGASNVTIGGDDAADGALDGQVWARNVISGTTQNIRSEERRVGKECRCRWSTSHEQKAQRPGAPEE